jgi:hypothetical protein
MKRRELFEQIEARHAKRARRLVGRDDAARLRWLIRFAEDGGGRTSRLPSVNFDRVAAAIEAFAERGGALARSVGRDLTVEAAEQLARIVRDGLRAYANQVTPISQPSMSTACSSRWCRAATAVPGWDPGTPCF